MGKLSRTKGHSFERKIAKLIRDRFPELENVRRSFQARDAEESDVTGLPGFWLECQDAALPLPIMKLHQAERDLANTALDRDRIPVAITHKKGARSIQVTLRAKDLICLLATEQAPKDSPVTLDFEDFLHILELTQPWNSQS
jgi:hypothetical protein